MLLMESWLPRASIMVHALCEASLMKRTLPTLAFAATVFMVSCAANPNAPSPVKKEDPPAASRPPNADALLALNAATNDEADARCAGLRRHVI